METEPGAETLFSRVLQIFVGLALFQSPRRQDAARVALSRQSPIFVEANSGEIGPEFGTITKIVSPKSLYKMKETGHAEPWKLLS